MCVSHLSLHCGIVACWHFSHQLHLNSQWCGVMHSVESRVADTSSSRYQQLQPVRAAVNRMFERVQEGALWDSPKVIALMQLLREKRWMRQWQASKRASEEEEDEREATTGSRPVGGITVILVHSPAMVRPLQAFLAGRVAASIVEGPTPNAAHDGGSEQQRLSDTTVTHSRPVRA